MEILVAQATLPDDPKSWPVHSRQGSVGHQGVGPRRSSEGPLASCALGSIYSLVAGGEQILDLPRSQRRKRGRFQASFRAGCENPENTEPWSGAVHPWTDTGETSLRGAHSSQSCEWVIPGPLCCPHGPKAMGSGHPGCMEVASPVESMFWKNHSRGCGMGPVSEGGSVLRMCAPTAVPGGRPAHCAFTERGLPGHCGNRHSPNKSKCRLFAQSLPWGGHPR